METDLLGAAEALPVHWLVFQVLLVLTFLLHLLVMNIALGGSLLAAVQAWHGPPGPDPGKPLPTTLALAVNLGVPPLLFVQVLYGPLFYTSSILMAAFWLSVIGMLIVAYYAAYLARHSHGRRGYPLWSTLSALLLLIVAFCYTNNLTLMATPSLWVAWPGHTNGTLLALGEPSLVPRYLHFVTGALAVASLARAVRAWWRARGQAAPNAAGDDPDLARGLRQFVHFTALEMALGLAWVALLPLPARRALMGGNGVATGLLAVGIALAIGLLAMAWRRRLWPTLWGLVATLLVMILLRDQVRHATLQGVYDPAAVPVQWTWGPLALFLVVFVVGLGTLGWMVRAAIDPAQRVGQEVQS
jgi:uncharacterized membrane protein YhdT